VRRLLLLACAALLPVLATAQDLPPPEPRELRAAWVATVAHIDWPSRPGLAPAQQRAEAITLLDRAREIGLNALILQVRPAGDALYPSSLEPWSEFLTGAQGRAPEPPWDPLAFWLAEAHRRGLELHAWFNPYRARHSSAKSPLAPPHIALRAPAAVKTYGDQLWMDPGEPAAFAHTLAVLRDVLTRYALDGLHIDDYFYPYPVKAPGSPDDLPFPDDAAFERYRSAGGLLARDDWRRANVDAMVQALHEMVRTVRPTALFGISPFGIGKPERRPPGITGFSQYDKLYADVERWFDEGWLDYLAPQLYWPIDRPGQQFPALLDYWIANNAHGRHLWPGLFTSQVRPNASDAPGPRAWPARELLDQVALTRSRAGTGGHIHFSMVALLQDRDGLAKLLKFGPYAQPALVPATPWLDAPVPPAPRLLRDGGRVRIDTTEAPARWAVWRRIGGVWRFAVQPAAERMIAPEGADRIVVSAVGRGGRTGERALITLP
jgi:uncharacterized lipoprotein YddW (UPF0748 family)